MAWDHALGSLLLDAGIPRYYLANWFLDCRLEASVLYVPDRESGETLARLFGSQLRDVLPALTIKVDVAKPKPKPSAMKKSWHQMQDKQARLSEDL